MKHYEEGSCDPAPLSGQRSTPGANQRPPCDFGSVELIPGGTGPRIVSANGATLDKFAELLSLDLDRPVINRTGITAQFDFRLVYTFNSATGAQAGKVDDTGLSLFTAIQEQLGLKLESAQGPVGVLVIDSVSKPTEN